MQKVILSGMQPSGDMHLGNFLGGIMTWKKMLSEYPDHRFYFMLADLHTLTSLRNPAVLRQNILETAKFYYACGIDFTKSNITLFQQSKIWQHTSLAWIFQTLTPIGWLQRMTQFKDKSGNKDAENINTGIFTYPTLMAADILLYNADFVPVGEDQKQHIELARDIASRFNREYSTQLFKEPTPIILEVKRIMSLSDGTKKMSKSDPSDSSRITFSDSNDAIAKKISRAKTDSIPTIYYDRENRPEISNLINIVCLLKNQDSEITIRELNGLNTKGLKDMLTDLLISIVDPIRKQMISITDDEIRNIIDVGNKNALHTADECIDKVYRATGLFL